MIAAHKGVAPAPLFGLGGAVAPEALPDATLPDADTSSDNLFDMISEALGGADKPAAAAKADHSARDKPVVDDARLKPARPVEPSGEIADVPPANVGELIRRSENEDQGLVPPMDVGATGSTGERSKPNGTLLDLILQQ